jgi:predicted outer membrane repeat protein
MVAGRDLDRRCASLPHLATCPPGRMLMISPTLGVASMRRRAKRNVTPRRLVSAAAMVGLAALLLASQAAADDFEVTRTDDPAPAGCVSAVDCSLREAVIAANATAGGDRILLPPGTYTLSIAGATEDLAATGDLDLYASDIEIRGTGSGPSDTVIDATGLGDWILDVLPIGDVRILNLTLRGGTEVEGGAIRSVRELTIRRVVFDQNSATDKGGAIHSSDDNARVTIEDSTFSNNSSADKAGAIWNSDASTFVIARSTFSGNVAADRGGAIYNSQNGAVTLEDCFLENNRAEDSGAGNDGGAVFTENSSSFTIVRSVLTGNLAEEAGGAIFVQNDSALTIVDTTISGNMALGTGSSEGGGAIYANNDSALLIERSTISGNHSDGDAGGISRNNDGQLLLRNSTISGNSAGGNGGGLIFDSSGAGDS